MRLLHTLTMLACCAVVAVACTDDNPAFVDPAKCPLEGEDLYLQTFAASQPTKVDVIIVVDATPQAEALRASLAQSAGTITTALEGLDWRVAVVSAGSQGAFNNPGTPGCPAQPFVEDGSPDPAGALGCLLQVPNSQNLPSAFDTLVNAVGSNANPGFVRRDARLVVLAVSLFDDCSSGGAVRGSLDECEWRRSALTPVTNTVNTLRNLKDDLNAVAFGAIVGPDDGRTFSVGVAPEPVCTGSFGPARHGIRYWEMASQLGPWGYTASVCTNNIQPALREAVGSLAFASETRYCLGLKPTQSGVVGVEYSAGNNSTVELPSNASNGFAFVGPSQRCAAGEVSVGFEAVRGVDTNNLDLDVFFCGP